MSDIIRNAIERWKKTGPLITPALIRKFARGAVSRNIHLATLLGQPINITAEQVVAQYYRARGLCAESQIPLMHHTESPVLAIELDHIIPVDRRNSLKLAFTNKGESRPTGLAASIDNVRLVCKLAHRIRHGAESSGVDFSLFCSMYSDASTKGCSVDCSIPMASQTSTRVLEKASDLVRQALANTDKFTSLEDVCGLLESNHVPLSYDQTRKLMVSVLGMSLLEYRSRFRLSVVRSAIEGDDELREELVRSGRTQNVVDAINKRFLSCGCSPISGMGMRPYFQKLKIQIPSGVTSTGKTRKKNAVCSSIRSNLWAFAKSKGLDGFFDDELHQRFPSWGRALVALSVSDAINRNIIERNGGKLFGRLTRQEAARVLGITADVLKKYAVMGKAPPHLIAAPGGGVSGVQATYSIHELVEWRRINPGRQQTGTYLRFLEMSGLR